MPKINSMKNYVFFFFLLFSLVSFGQVYTSENEDTINFSEKKAKINIDNFNYKGNFEVFTSKKDKKNFIIYSYFSRTVVFSVNKSVKEIENSTEEFKIEDIKLIHNNNTKSIIKQIKGRGINNLQKLVLIDHKIDSLTFKKIH